MDELKYVTKSIWDKADSKQQKSMHEYAKKYIKFISENKTERECIQAVLKRLQESGFSSDFKKGSYVAVLHNKSLFAVRKGKKDLSHGFRLVTAPALISNKIRFLNVWGLHRQRPIITVGF